MKAYSAQYTNGQWSKGHLAGKNLSPSIIFAFGSRSLLSDDALIQSILDRSPGAHIVGCSTAGEIIDDQVNDESLVYAALEFESSSVRVVDTTVSGPEDSYRAGKAIAETLNGTGLRHIILLSDGLHVNGTALVAGVEAGVLNGVTVSGGLAGDGANFVSTVVRNGNKVESKLVVGVGLYGEDLLIGCGSLGGWDVFGPERKVTRSEGNKLYELDNEPALELYKRYLGDQAAGLPASGLLFPLAIRRSPEDRQTVRTILAVDEKEGSLTFAGDIPLGCQAMLMRANFDRLVDGAVGAAESTKENLGIDTPVFALLISCVGRKLILGQRIEEEIEGVREALGSSTVFAGFYSYGEVSPFQRGAKCELHNQTMTVTTIHERIGGDSP